jgi:protocatechuate 3,4-dioxygenase beta subunit
MNNDDAQIGRLLSRREVLSLMGGAGVALLVGCSHDGNGSPTASVTAGSTTRASTESEATVAAPACVVRPAETEGPYFVDEKLNRADIRSDPSNGALREGAPLALTFLVSRVGNGACAPLEGASVDVWHCDAAGVYSDVTDNGAGSFRTVGQKFLRGYQVTDASGKAAFTTIYPGWYSGRAVHIHFKIRTSDSSGKAFDFTSQLYFDDSLTDQVHTRAPYSAKGKRDTRNADDGIYPDGGDQLLLEVAPSGSGFAATFEIGLQGV